MDHDFFLSLAIELTHQMALEPFPTHTSLCASFSPSQRESPVAVVDRNKSQIRIIPKLVSRLFFFLNRRDPFTITTGDNEAHKIRNCMFGERESYRFVDLDSQVSKDSITDGKRVSLKAAPRAKCERYVLEIPSDQLVRRLK